LTPKRFAEGGRVPWSLPNSSLDIQKPGLEQPVFCYLGHEKTTSHIRKYSFKSMACVIGFYL
jgi:hypothetical protein